MCVDQAMNRICGAGPGCGCGAGRRSSHRRAVASSRMPRRHVAVATFALLVAHTSSDAGALFGRYTDCASCVGAGFGWSLKKGKCGGYANKECPSAPPMLA